MNWSLNSEWPSAFKSPTLFWYEAQESKYQLIKCDIYWYEEWAMIIKTKIEILFQNQIYDSHVNYKKIS